MPPTRVPILMYHKVAPADPRSTLRGHYVSPKLFARHLAVLKALGFRSTGLESIFQPEAGRRVVITFDDGYRNFHQNALPHLARLGFSATVFLVAGQLGGTNAWDAAIGDVQEPLMSLEEISDAAGMGTVFGSHTMSHANLAQLDLTAACREIAESKEVLEEKLGRPIASFCYPYGAVNDEVRDMVRRAGYACACSTEKGSNGPDVDPYRLKRINIRRDTLVPVFIMKLWRSLRLDR